MPGKNIEIVIHKDSDTRYYVAQCSECAHYGVRAKIKKEAAGFWNDEVESQRKRDYCTDGADSSRILGLPKPAAYPFCGFDAYTNIITAPPEDTNDVASYRVLCGSCFAEGPVSDSQLEAAIGWNNAAKTSSPFNLGPFIEGLAKKPGQDVELSDLDAVATRLDIPLGSSSSPACPITRNCCKTKD